MSLSPVEITSPAFFDAHFSKELARAKRYGRRLSLIVFGVRSQGGDAQSPSIRGVAPKILETLRGADLATVQGGELLVLLPETDRLGALLVQQRALSILQQEAALLPKGAGGGPALRSGSAACPEDGTDAGALLSLARKRADEERHSLVWNFALEGLDFWTAVERLLTMDLGNRDTSYRGYLSQSIFAAAQVEAARELGRSSTTRGILVVCQGGEVRQEKGDTTEPGASVIEALPSHAISGSVFFGGKKGSLHASHPSLVFVPLEGEARAARYEVLLFLAGHSSYALIRDGSEGGLSLHTTDLPLVRHLVAGFRETHDPR